MSKKILKKSASRYRGIIVSITLFVLIVVATLGLNVYATQQIRQDTLIITTTSQMRDAVQTITRDLFDAKNSWGEDPESPHMSSLIDRLKSSNEYLTKMLNVFQNGGEITDSQGGSTRFSGLNATTEELALVGKMESIWKGFRPPIETYIKSTEDIFSTSAPLDIAVERAKSDSVIIYDLMNELVQDVETTTKQRAFLLTTLQYAALGITLLYFLIFIFFFIRRLRKSDASAAAAEQETADIMNTVTEGLFLIDRDLQIGNQYSTALEKILNTKDIAGRNLKDLLDKMVTAVELDTTNDFIDQLYNPRVRENLIHDLNPLDKIKVNIDDGRGNILTRWLKFHFARVYEGDDNQNIKHVLTSVSDITAAVNLELRLTREREQNNQQVEMLTTILRVDDNLMSSFVRNANGCNSRVNNILRRPHHRQQDLKQKVEDIFREIHSFKGEASALQLSGFVDLSNELEDKLKNLRTVNQLSGDDFLPLAVTLDQLIDLTSRVEQLFNRINSRGGITNGDIKEGNSGLVDAKALISHFQQFAEQIAERNGKDVHLNTKGFEGIELSVSTMDITKEILTQLMRNAIVHGIETPTERKAAGKNETGTIQLQLQRLDDNYLEMVVEDDGHGINFKALRDKAAQLPQYKNVNVNTLPQKELLKILFLPGFSTATTSSEDAGRGVGMNVIKDRIQNLHGKLAINSIDGKSCNFTIRFPA